MYVGGQPVSPSEPEYHQANDVSDPELTPEGERLAREFIAALESQTELLGAEWSSQREELATGLLSEISEALDAVRQPPKRRMRRARRA